MKKDLGGLVVILLVLLAGFLIGIPVGGFFWVSQTQKTERALCEKKMQEQGMMETSQKGKVEIGIRFTDEVDETIKKPTVNLVKEVVAREIALAVAKAEALGDSTPIEETRQRFNGNKEEAARITRTIQELKAKPSIQD